MQDAEWNLNSWKDQNEYWSSEFQLQVLVKVVYSEINPIFPKFGTMIQSTHYGPRNSYSPQSYNIIMATSWINFASYRYDVVHIWKQLYNFVRFRTIFAQFLQIFCIFKKFAKSVIYCNIDDYYFHTKTHYKMIILIWEREYI